MFSVVMTNRRQSITHPVDVHSCIRQPIPAQHIAIIDDVMTTGSTVHELAIVLKKAGVARVDVWVCARA